MVSEVRYRSASYGGTREAISRQSLRRTSSSWTLIRTGSGYVSFFCRKQNKTVSTTIVNMTDKVCDKRGML